MKMKIFIFIGQFYPFWELMLIPTLNAAENVRLAIFLVCRICFC